LIAAIAGLLTGVSNSVTDYFAVLGQPRRPWLDLDQLKQKYQQLTFELHPDRPNADADQADFAAVTEAYRVLSNPRLRVHHLLSLNAKNADTGSTKTSRISNELAELFMAAAELVREIDAYCQKREQMASALAKSLLQADTVQLKSRAEEMLERLQSRYAAALEDLRRLDETWAKNSSTVTNQLLAVADRLGYLDRWTSQLRERQFQLST
jgi:curved DNA-binding protein CbpA